MTPEEIERTIQFILQHEAQVFARIDRLSETAERHEKAIERHDREISQVTDLVGRLAQAEIHLLERMGALAGRMDALAERMDELAASHKETGERLNALIVTVERYIAGRDGNRRRGKKKRLSGLGVRKVKRKAAEGPRQPPQALTRQEIFQRRPGEINQLK